MDFVLVNFKLFHGLLWWSLICELALGATFYGDGFVQLKAEDLSSRNSLHISFRTSSSNGLLFLAAGRTDYFLVNLNDGRLQVKLGLGSGEHELQSERSTLLNDLAWHTVDVLHEPHNLSLTVDRNWQSSLNMAGPLEELSVLDGLFVGGPGGLDKLYLPSGLTGFRGCIDKAVFSEHDLLSSLKPYSGLKTVHEVSLGCSPEFFANEDDPVSFFSSRAYISLPRWNAHHEGSFECVVHTSAKDGIILYNSASNRAFVALEIQDGFPVATVGHGETKIELQSPTVINDKTWHSVKLFFNQKILQLTVDMETMKTNIGTVTEGLKLKGYLFVGGVDDGIRSEVRKIGLVSVSGKRVRGGSLKGCLQQIKVNGVTTGIPNAIVTKDISVGCEPEKEPEPFATLSHSPVAPTTPTSVLQMSTLAMGLDRKYGSNFVQVRSLVVPEGGRASLESKHIKVFLDFKRLGIRQSQILFRIQEQPVHGQIRLDVEDQEENTFSMLDLWHGRVMYIHGGSEDPEDFFIFSVFSSSRKEVPDYLKGTIMFCFNATVTPTNDAPELSLPEGNLFVLLENSRKHLTTEVLKATDIDSNYTNLVFSVLGNLNIDSGFLEIQSNPGKAVTTFSYSDLKDLQVNFVHTGVRNSRIALRVSDGEKVSNTVVLRVMAVALEYKIANNTGLEITQGDAFVIGSRHLAVQTNAVRQVVDIRYDIIRPPRFGELQRLHSSGEWKLTSSFSQKLLEKDRFRYASTFKEVQTANDTDYFMCKVTVASRETTEVVFPVIVKWINYSLVKNAVAHIDKVRKLTLDSKHLYARSEGVVLPEDDLYFRVLSQPKKGQLLLDDVVLKSNSSFSQRHVSDLKLQYELIDRPYEDTNDTFRFHVYSRHAHSQSYEFLISIKADANSVFIRNSGLSLFEGESRLITKDELFAETLSTKEMYYSIVTGPKNGKLNRINRSNSTESYNNILTFSNQDILQKRILYVHDDSETIQDDFTFIASKNQEFKSSILAQEIGAQEGKFNISIQLVNDQKPVRVVDKVFHVVRNGQRLLTSSDLRYHDADSDFSDSQLFYTRRGIPVGDLVLVNDTSQRLFQFRQKDLDEKRVLFIHKGGNSGRFVLFVSDGKNFVSSLLDVSADEPFLEVENNTGLLVQKGQSVVFLPGNFSVRSNLDIRSDAEVIYNVYEAPQNGGLFYHKAKVGSFTQDDLNEGLISYHHDDSKNLADSFSLRVQAKGLQLDAKVNVKVYLESHQRPPIVQQNNIIHVDEGKPVKIDVTKLEVTHEDNLASEIVFRVNIFPSHGFLRCFDEAKGEYIGSEQYPIKTFSQQDVNAGNIQYMQMAANQLNDTFVLAATNGVTEVSNIRMSVDIIPKFIPLQVYNFTVKEGGSKALTKEVLNVVSLHFSGLNFLYNVSEPPQHGHIEYTRYPGKPITSFTRRQVDNEMIYYVHDSSETLEDSFTVVANDTVLRKHSAPERVFIQITAINDEVPVITANRVLQVWVESLTELSSEDLKAQDVDTPPDQLHFLVTPPSNGHLALKKVPMKAVLNFTQEDIDHGQLLFVHTGAMSGGFNFQVNDGENFAPRQIFSITASALVLNLEVNRHLKVFPGSLTAITKEDLQASTNDRGSTANRTVTFSVVRPPRLGRLVKLQADNSTKDISVFTQHMVDQREVAFLQSPVESVGWAAMDSMTFSVASPPASLESQTFWMDISYENVGPDRKTLLLANTGAVVTEGKSVVIDKSKLDASNLMYKLPTPQWSAHEIWYQVKSLPQHGVIIVGERNLTKEKPNFSQFIVNKYGITYHHDNSESTHDSFEFETWLNPKGKAAQRPVDDVNVLEEGFNITVLPVNDQPPVLKTKAPSVTLVQGDTVVLGPNNLQVEDLDNPPEDIKYSVISAPNNGYLALGGKLNESLVSFTQAQINNGSVYFIHDGSPASGAFYFSVTDGHHKPVYKLFNLEVNKITIVLVNNTGLFLQQSQTSVLIKPENLAAETNGKNTTSRYRVTKPPTFGKLLIGNQEVTQFEDEDLRVGRLRYQMVNLSSGQDSLEFTTYTSEANLTDQVLNITVTPLIQLAEQVKIANGILIPLNTGFLNASVLANLSGSDPLFEVVSQPKYGKVFLRNPQKGEKVDVKFFSYQDLKEGKLAIKLNANMTTVQELNDSLVFILTAGDIQPAKGEFQFTITPYDPVGDTTKTPVQTTMPSFQTFNQTTSVGRAVTATSFLPTRSPDRNQQKFKQRNRWGISNGNDSFTTTLSKPTLGREDILFQNTPVRVESYPQKSSNPLLVILPLLALLLLFVIFVVLIVLVQRSRQRKQNPVKAKYSPNPVAPGTQSYKGQRSTTVALVTVTPLRPHPPDSFDGLEPQWATAPNGESSTHLGFRNKTDRSSDQFIRTTSPSLQKNQYWV
ncbi:chondroitin sulfate proteoglycan 4 [Aplochiton taeniatus]